MHQVKTGNHQNFFMLENERSNASTPYASLHSAVYEGDVNAVQALLSRGLSVNEPDSLGSTLLHIAPFNGDDWMIKVLLNHNAKVDAHNHLGLTPIHTAARAGHLEIFKILLNSSKLNGKPVNIDIRTSSTYETPLHFAALEGHLDLIKYIIQNGGTVETQNTNGYTPLHLAVIRGHPKSVEELVKHVPNFTNKPQYGRLIYIAAVGNENIDLDTEKELEVTKLSDEQQLKYAEIIDILLHAGCQFRENVGFRTPLLCALSFNHHLIIQKLLYWGSNVNIISDNGRSPLHEAVVKSDPKIIKMLLKAGGDLTKESRNGFLPIHYLGMCKKYKILSILIAAGADINAKTSFNTTIVECIMHINPEDDFLIYMILRYNFDINAIIYDGNTPLYTLCSFYNCKVSCILLDWFLDFNVVNEEDETPLQFVINRGCSKEHIKFIIKAMVHMQSHKNFTISSLNMAIITSNSYLDFYKHCQQELENLKKKKVWGIVSFIDLLKKPLEKIRNYTQNDGFMENINSGTLNLFSAYGDLIKSRIDFAIRMRKLHDKSLEFLRKCYPCPDIGYDILSFLNLDELEKLALM